jgi:hypothetical protein
MVPDVAEPGFSSGRRSAPAAAICTFRDVFIKTEQTGRDLGSRLNLLKMLDSPKKNSWISLPSAWVFLPVIL